MLSLLPFNTICITILNAVRRRTMKITLLFILLATTITILQGCISLF